MDFKVFGKEGGKTLLLIPGLGVSYEIFLSLIGLLEDKFRIVAVQVDGFTLGKHTRFTSIDDQAAHLKTIFPDVHIEIFPKSNHGQLLVDHPDEVAKRIKCFY